MTPESRRDDRQRSAGLPAGPLYDRRILFVRGLQKVILTCTVWKPAPIGHVFIRPLTTLRYEPLVACDEQISLTSPIVCTDPVLIAIKSDVDLGPDPVRPIAFRCLIRVDLSNS